MTKAEDERDMRRLDQVASLLSKQIGEVGLRPRGAKRVESWTSGWGIPFATWDKDRPVAGVSLDQGLGGTTRTFWFGFWSSKKEPIASLVKQIGNRLGEPAKLESSDYTAASKFTRISGPVVQDVKKADGLAWEKYSKYSEHYFGKYALAASFAEPKVLAAFGIMFFDSVISAVDPFLAERRDIAELEEKGTDKEALVLARRGQGKFRQKLIEYWGGCAVTGCSSEHVLRASHIKPWSACSDKKNHAQRLDVQNGILLSANLDALFDRALISFSPSGEMLVSNKLSKSEKQDLGILEPRHLRRKPDARQRKFLKHHNKRFEEKNAV